MTDAIIDARQPDPGRPGLFRRTFLMSLKDVPEQLIRDITHPMHARNVREAQRDGQRRGLRHGGQEAVVDEVLQREDGLTAVTYAIQVAPTRSAAAVSSSTNRTPPKPPVPGPEPEFTIDPEPAGGEDEDDGPADTSPKASKTVPAPRRSRGRET